MSERNKITIVQKKIIKSLLYGAYDVMNMFFARIHTCGKNAEYWLYSGLEGALVYCIDIRVKACRFLMVDLKTYEIVFDCELYKRFDRAYKKGTERFYYFEVENGFIGFEIPNMEQAEILSASIISFGDDYIKKKLKEYKAMKENELKEKAKKMIGLLEQKFGQENLQPKMLRSEIVLRHGLLEKMINTVELNDETGTIIVKGTGYQGVDSDLLKLNGLNLDLKTELKVGDSEIFTKYIARNILRSYMKGLIIPKRKINRGGGVTIGKTPKYEENNTANEQEDQQQEEEQPQEEINESKPKPPPISHKISQEKIKPKPEPPKQETPPPRKSLPPPPPKQVTSPPKQPSPPPMQPSPPPKQVTSPPKQPSPPPKPSKKEEVRESSPPKVEAPSSSPKGVPPPPPPPPPPPVIKTIKSSSSKSSKPVDLAAELAAKKKNLTKVETKDLSIPNVQKSDKSSSVQSGNSMMSAIMAQRNAMKRVSAPQIPTSSLKKTETKTKAPVTIQKKTTTTTQPPKTNINTSLKKAPTSSTKAPIKPTSTTKVNAFSSKPANTGAKQPLKMSAGGGGGFAAMRNMLANRMGPQPTKKQDEGPKKPIVELASGNVPRMNMSKLMASLESNMGKSESTSNEPIKVVSGSGSGVPPPPPPPPPPPVK